MPAVLITGASRGIGLELARQYAASGKWHVIATCRDPEGADALQSIAGGGQLRIEALDVTDHTQVDTLAARLQGVPIDVLINNAGIGDRGATFGSYDYASWRNVLETNLLGPVKVAEALLPNVLAGELRKIVSVSSSLGSISKTWGGNMYYRTSKAGLNMAMRSLAMELRKQGVLVALLSPGVVDTDFTRAADIPGKIPVGTSAAGLIEIIDKLTLADAGTFIRYNGETVPW